MIKTHPANKEKPIVIYRSQTEAKNDHKHHDTFSSSSEEVRYCHQGGAGRCIHQNIKPDNNSNYLCTTTSSMLLLM